MNSRRVAEASLLTSCGFDLCDLTIGSIPADSFTQALRQFISRRSNVRITQNGKTNNFNEAVTELKKSFSKTNKHKINNLLVEIGEKWIH